MCGIFGALALQGVVSRDDVSSMSGALRHRGPDSNGIWVDGSGTVVLGHTRLAILDLSPLGAQPMGSHSGRFTITFNGEVYNYLDLRRELELLGASFKGGSDTEVILACFEQWGVVESLKRFNGMLAIAVWDSVEQILYLARDKVGKKPLYYGTFSNRLWFASELTAFYTLADFKPSLCYPAVQRYLEQGYVPTPFSIYENVWKLPAGSYLQISVRSSASNDGVLPTPLRYWNFEVLVRGWRSEQLTLPAEELVNRLDTLLRSAVQLRTVADVPLGAFLSGGIDSSLIVALLQAQRQDPVRTFSIGFAEDRFNEAHFAKEIATYLGTAHTELYVSAEDALKVVPKLSTIFSEPFADSSQIPTYLVSQLARRSVTVALSGDGGDELFSGYSRYVWLSNLWRGSRWLTGAGRSVLSAFVLSIPPRMIDRAYDLLRPLLPTTLSFSGFGEKVRRSAEMLGCNDFTEYYRKALQFWVPNMILNPDFCPPQRPGSMESRVTLSETVESMMSDDFMRSLHDDILVKVDRATMACSLEARAPLLDPRVIEFAWRLPRASRLGGGATKVILRQVLARYLPLELFERPKKGFGVPLAAWLRGPLKEWACDLLSESTLKVDGIFNQRQVAKILAEHLEGKRDFHYLLWILLMFQQWRNETRELNKKP